MNPDQVRIYLQKNDLSKNDKMPYFNLVLPPEKEGGEWITIGALWKAKSGKGYTGVMNEGVKIDIVNMKKFNKPSED